MGGEFLVGMSKEVRAGAGAEAKKPETRDRRVAQTLEKLRKGKA
jgi:Bacteriocin-protection, YdeI or OmpD-Associated